MTPCPCCAPVKVAFSRSKGDHVRDVTQQYLKTVATEYAERHPDFIEISESHVSESSGTNLVPRRTRLSLDAQDSDFENSRPHQDRTGSGGQRILPGGSVGSRSAPGFVSSGRNRPGNFHADPAGSAVHLEVRVAGRVGGPAMVEIEIEVSRTLEAPGENRPLGLVFTTFTIK